ncbi:MAG: hypothetical protein ACRDNF_04805 [Streptosporangiaceae bacterium]
MEISRNAKGAMSFLIMAIITVVYDVVGDCQNPSWNSKVPMWLMHRMPFLMNVFIPFVFLVAAFALAYIFMGYRRGYVIALAFGVLTVVYNVLPGIWRLQAHAADGAAICGFEIIMGLIMMWYAYAGFREASPVRAATRDRTRVKSAA